MKHCHLPDAVRFADRAALAGLSDARLRTLLRECDDWQARMEEFRHSLHTSVARTEWHVHTRQDRADVVAAVALVRDEVRARSVPIAPAATTDESAVYAARLRDV